LSSIIPDRTEGYRKYPMTSMPVTQIAIFRMGFKNLLPAIVFLVTSKD